MIRIPSLYSQPVLLAGAQTVTSNSLLDVCLHVEALLVTQIQLVSNQIQTVYPYSFCLLLFFWLMGTINQSAKSFGRFHPLQGEAQASGTEPRDLGESHPSTFPSPCPALCIPATPVPFYPLVSFLQLVIYFF